MTKAVDKSFSIDRYISTTLQINYKVKMNAIQSSNLKISTFAALIVQILIQTRFCFSLVEPKEKNLTIKRQNLISPDQNYSTDTQKQIHPKLNFVSEKKNPNPQQNNFYKEEVTPEEFEILYHSLLRHADKFKSASTNLKFPAFLDQIPLSKNERARLEDIISRLESYWALREGGVYENCWEYMEMLACYSLGRDWVAGVSDVEYCQWSGDGYIGVKKSVIGKLDRRLREKVIRCEGFEDSIWRKRCDR